MKTLHRNLIVALMAGTYLCGGVAAAYAAEGGNAAAPTPPARSALQNAQTPEMQAQSLMTRMVMARVALDLSDGTDARMILKEAQNEARQILAAAPSADTVETMRSGKITVQASDVTHDYLVPAADDFMVVDQLAGKVKDGKAKGIDVTDAAVVHTHLDLNIASVSAAIDQASELAAKGDLAAASKAMDGAFNGAVSEQEVLVDPLWTVYDNLVLTQTFLNGGHDQAAQYSLKNARAQLDAFKKANPGATDPAIDTMGLDMKELSSLLSADENSRKAHHDDILAKIKHMIDTAEPWHHAKSAQAR
ncbi:MAG: YfdX family protein [Rhodospirillales bacterium]|nr:YfdX family protein [Alphaproteobacteria bacterium]MCB9987055.1 YfdX family protein [Rhodospirillales bacterium]USO08177.1 MAG: YfdX family protein [Rhodospirillales bacterium]